MLDAYNRGMDLSDDEAIKRECGRRIKAARIDAGMTQQELAGAVGLAASTIGNYEQGTRLPGPKEATLLGKTLGVSPAYVLLVEDVDMLLFQGEAALLKKYRTLTPQEQKVIDARITHLSRTAKPKKTRKP